MTKQRPNYTCPDCREQKNRDIMMGCHCDEDIFAVDDFINISFPKETPIHYCFVCGKDTRKGFVFTNNREEVTFINMPLKERCHAECYVDLCVKISIDKYLSEIKNEKN